jgi:hypothetical protein
VVEGGRHDGRMLKRTLMVCAATLLATNAYAQSPNAAPPAKTDKTEKKADDKKADDKKVDDKKADEKGKSGSDRASRVAKQHEDQKAKLQGMLKSPMDAPLREELRRHAERAARIERIKTVATDAKDNDSIDRAQKLLAKENARHDKWMEKHVATTTDTKGGAK